MGIWNKIVGSYVFSIDNQKDFSELRLTAQFIGETPVIHVVETDIGT